MSRDSLGLPVVMPEVRRSWAETDSLAKLNPNDV